MQCPYKNDATEEEKEEFYEQLQTSKMIPKTTSWENLTQKWETTTLHVRELWGRQDGMGDRNENKQELVEFCSENEMVVVAWTLFHHNDIQMYA